MLALYKLSSSLLEPPQGTKICWKSSLMVQRAPLLDLLKSFVSFCSLCYDHTSLSLQKGLEAPLDTASSSTWIPMQVWLAASCLKKGKERNMNPFFLLSAPGHFKYHLFTWEHINSQEHLPHSPALNKAIIWPHLNLTNSGSDFQGVSQISSEKHA